MGVIALLVLHNRQTTTVCSEELHTRSALIRIEREDDDGHEEDGIGAVLSQRSLALGQAVHVSLG